MNVGDTIIIVGSDRTGEDSLHEMFTGEVGTIAGFAKPGDFTWGIRVDIGNGRDLWVHADEIEPFDCG